LLFDGKRKRKKRKEKKIDEYLLISFKDEISTD